MTSSSKVDWNLFYTLLQNFSPDVKRVAELGMKNQIFFLLNLNLYNIFLLFLIFPSWRETKFYIENDKRKFFKYC